MHVGIPLQTSRGIRPLKNQRGVILIEVVISCLVLLVFMFGSIEMWSLVQDKIHLQRVVRDAAREAVLTDDINNGVAKGYDRAQQYFGDTSKVDIDLTRQDSFQSHLVTGEATLRHPVFGTTPQEWWGAEVTLSAKAVFGYKDFTEGYE